MQTNALQLHCAPRCTIHKTLKCTLPSYAALLRVKCTNHKSLTCTLPSIKLPLNHHCQHVRFPHLFLPGKAHFNTKLQELTEGLEAVEKLMDNLERKKDNCLQRTYREVGIEFAKVFAELVPGGEGHLLMVGEGGDYTGVKVRWGIFFVVLCGICVCLA